MEEIVNREEVYKEGVRFPISIKESGINYIGINKTLNKPHGLEEIMRSIIKLIIKRPIKYETLLKKLVGKHQRINVEDAVEILKKDGVIQILSKNTNPRKGNYFRINKIFIDPRAEIDINTEKNINTETRLSQLKVEVDSIIRDSDHWLAVHLRNCLDRSELTDSIGNVVVDVNAWVSFRSVSLTLAYSVHLQENEKFATLREISVKIWGRSKILDRYREKITKVAGVSLSKLNFNIMPENTYLYGDITGIVNGKSLSGLSGYPVVLTDITIKNLNIIEVNAKNILIIENSAVFLSAFNKKYIRCYDTILVWGEGYLSYPKRELIKKILNHTQLSVYIWSDLDGDGLELTLDIIKFVGKLGAKGQAILMGENELKFASGKFKGANHINLEREDFKTYFPDVIDLIKEGRTMEQEELLLYYKEIEGKLP